MNIKATRPSHFNSSDENRRKHKHTRQGKDNLANRNSVHAQLLDSRNELYILIDTCERMMSNNDRNKQFSDYAIWKDKLISRRARLALIEDELLEIESACS